MRQPNHPTVCWSVLLPATLSLTVLSLASEVRTQAQTVNSPRITVSPVDQSAEPQIAIRSDTQEVSPDKNLITANGNVFFLAPAQRVEATAAKVEYFRNERRVVLTGNVSLKQPNKTIKAEKVTCLLDLEECNAADSVPPTPTSSQAR